MRLFCWFASFINYAKFNQNSVNLILTRDFLLYSPSYKFRTDRPKLVQNFDCFDALKSMLLHNQKFGRLFTSFNWSSMFLTFSHLYSGLNTLMEIWSDVKLGQNLNQRGGWTYCNTFKWNNVFESRVFTFKEIK